LSSSWTFSSKTCAPDASSRAAADQSVALAQGDVAQAKRDAGPGEEVAFVGASHQDDAPAAIDRDVAQVDDLSPSSA
jgi:hypothetical protein